MYKLLFVFFMFVSSPLYSNEFKYHCDLDEKLLTTVYKINTTKQSVIHTHSIFSSPFKDVKSEVVKIDQNLYVHYWDEVNDSIWSLTHNKTSDGNQLMNLMLFNFKKQKLFVKTVTNDLSENQNNNDYSESDGYDIFDCYMME